MPGAPPFGSSPLTMPTPNRGNQAGAFALIQTAIRQLEEALPMLAAEPEMGPKLMRSVETLRGLVPEGAVPKGVADASMINFMQKERQAAPILGILNALRQGQSGGAPGGGAGGGLPGSPPALPGGAGAAGGPGLPPMPPTAM